ncbi:beta-2-glycoprotein 1-like [Betta splendens]|uniref:Beta-2-glycoprotein 1 n=1 Tax=Betta splendens TaxID=158456 RepID=A0A6P7LLT1_BETSP|nr:beta-2-glycoprotein 1-like [Betta splendens]
MDRELTSFLLCAFVFFITATSQQDNVCSRPELFDNIEMDGIQRYFNPGEELVLSCKQGYTPLSGPRNIVCAARGQWTKTKLKCLPKLCPYPDVLSNGALEYEDTTYQSVINYTCHEGYIMTGASSAVCQANGTWSSPVPECTAVSCGPAPIPEYGMIIYDRRIRGSSTDYGVTGTYRCLPPYVVTGNPRTKCTASGTWTAMPTCRVVTCPPPKNIDNGFVSSDEDREYDFMEAVKYGCHGHYVLEGSMQVVCQENGEWSEKPSCKAPCSVDIARGRILYNEKKVWIEDFNPNRVLHRETVSVYCKDTVRSCGYAVPTQCIDGNITIPPCFKEPSAVNYTLKSGSLPSEIQAC